MSKDTLGQILAGLILAGCVLVGITLSQNTPELNTTTFDCSRPVPPGFNLEVESGGSYRAVYSQGIELLSFKDNMTRCQALKRAWDQYDYEQVVESKTWKREELPNPHAKNN